MEEDILKIKEDTLKWIIKWREFGKEIGFDGDKIIAQMIAERQDDPIALQVALELKKELDQYDKQHQQEN
jgi:hypothetical protein